MNRSLKEIDGEALVVSQFTLFGDCSRGRRPSFIDAAPPERGRELYEYFIDCMRQQVRIVATGVFGEMMEVELVNDGPVTLILER
jgi:D-tyrosyl-tRNA(Tyr) deacylase